MRRRGNAASTRAVVALTTVLVVLAARPTPVVSGPRAEPPRSPAIVDRWRLPTPRAGPDFTTLPSTAPDGRTGTWLVSATALPLTFVVEREIADRFGFATVAGALRVWNDTPGSRFEVAVTGPVDTDATHKARDGTSRVFLDRRDCDGAYLARAHLFPSARADRGGTVATFVDEVDIGICDRLTAQRLAGVLRHEVAHAAGLGHLCEPGDDCWQPGVGQDHGCRVMFPAAAACQQVTDGDRDGLIHLHPRLPRVGGDDLVGSLAGVAYLTAPEPRAQDGAVVVDARAPTELLLQAAVLAGTRSEPLLAFDDRCTEGPGGRELNRVVAVHATVTLVGSLAPGCVADLAQGWELEVRQLRDADAVARAVLAEHPGTDGVVLTAADLRHDLASAVTAVPAAVRRGAPLLTVAEGRLDDADRALLGSLVADEGAVTAWTVGPLPRRLGAQLTELGLHVASRWAGNTYASALTVASDVDLFGRGPRHVVLSAVDRVSLVTAAALAGALGDPLLVTPADHLDPAVRRDLEQHAEGGFVVGGVSALTEATFLNANRAVG